MRGSIACIRCSRKENPPLRTQGLGRFRNLRDVFIFKHQPQITEGKHIPILPLPSRMCSFVTSSRIPSLCKGWGAQAGKAWAGFGRKTWQARGPAARLPWRPRCPPHLLSPPRCPPAPLGQVEDRGAPAGWCSHRREACLSTVEELPPQGAWQRLRADAHTGGPGGGGPGLPGQILPICFC